MPVALTASQRREIIEHARSGRPEEVCGLLAGRDGRVELVYRAVNKEHSPIRYEIEPKDLLRIFRDIEERDLELVGIYHSHTHTDAYPSPTDVRLAYYPETLYFLVSLMNEEHPTLRAYSIRDGAVDEQEILIEDE
jgi:proteasome lid subunit RPN8/RPN11